MITASINIGPLLADIKRAAELTAADTEAMIRQEATLFVYNAGKIPGIINVTPPFSQGKKGKAGLEQGKGKIDADLLGIFAPVSLKGQRTITHLFGDKDPNVGRKPPYIVSTKERHPDVKAIYTTRNNRRGKGKSMTRGQAAAWYVDEQKFEALRKELHGHIGWACACWYAASVAAGLSPKGVPAWIRRHTSAPGDGASIHISATAFQITLSSALDYNDAMNMGDKARRVLGYRENALQRRLPYMVRAALKKANLNVA